MKQTFFRYALAIATVFVLSGCAIKPHVSVQDVKTPTPEPALQNSANKPPENNAFKNQQVMTPNEGIEKNKLLVSYSMKILPAEKGNLVKISMIFTNMKDQNTHIQPKITLADSQGLPISAYSKKSFLKLVSHKTDKSAASAPAASSQRMTDEKIKWANAYWLKDKFTLPPRGIEIGELIYHCTSLNFPMKLTVQSAGQNFVFDISDKSAAIPKQASTAP